MEQKVGMGKQLLDFVEDWQSVLHPDLKKQLVELAENPKEAQESDVSLEGLKACVPDMAQLPPAKLQEVVNLLNILAKVENLSGNEYLLKVLIQIKEQQPPVEKA